MTSESNAVRADESPSASNDAWYLHSQGRVFGPLDKDELIGYFRAGMVKAGDTIALPGQEGTVPAEQVAALLRVAPPVAAAAPSHPRPAILITNANANDEPRHLGWLLKVGALVAAGGIAYFALHVPLRAPEDPAPVAYEAPSVQASEAAPASTPVAQEFAAQDIAERMDAQYSPPAPDEGSASAAPLERAPDAGAAADAGEASDTNAAPLAPMRDEWWTTAARLMNQSNWVALRAHANEWAKAQPTRDLPWWYLGRADTFLGNWAEGEEALKHALALSPRHFRMRWALADLYLRSKRYEAAEEIFSELVREQPSDAALLNDIGIAWANLGEYDDAVAAFEKSVAISPGYRKAWRNLAQTYAHFGNMDKAKAALAKANGR